VRQTISFLDPFFDREAGVGRFETDIKERSVHFLHLLCKSPEAGASKRPKKGLLIPQPHASMDCECLFEILQIEMSRYSHTKRL